MADVEEESAASLASLDTPGPESFQAPSIRRWITLSYWTIILLGIPYWWHSTTIERHSLPLHDIEQWQNRGPCPIELPVTLSMTSQSGSNIQTDTLLKSLKQISRTGERCLVFRPAAISTPSSYDIILRQSASSEARIRGNRTAEIAFDNVSRLAPSIADLIMPSSPSTKFRHAQFSQSSKAVRYASKYKLVFSLLNEDTGKGGIGQWDAETALNQHVYPLLDSLRDLHEYDVETQIQYYAPLTVERQLTDEGAVIAEDQLKVFVNSAEWNLASSVSNDPVLHFILYIPAEDKSPLLLRRSDGSVEPLTFFSIPQWGSVVIYNSHDGGANETPIKNALVYPELQEAFASFAALLRISHGIPSIESATGDRKDVADWEIQALMRERTVQNVRDAIQKLGAIARQVNEIQNMRIPKAVQEDVRGALVALTSVQSDDVREAMRQSAKAADLATRASFNHEMLAMLYFPDEHKWAVYTPLFGPIAVPLLVALFREIKEYKQRRRNRQKRE